MADGPTSAQMQAARDQLDAQVREVVQWHFSPETGTPFWLERAKSFKFNPLKDVQTFDDLKLFGFFEDDWLRGAPGLDIRRWVPRGFADKPVYIFETGGTTGIPKSRIVIEDHWIDYEQMSETLPEEQVPARQPLAHAGSVRPTAIAIGDRAFGSTSRRHLFLRRSRSPLGRPAHQGSPHRRSEPL